MKLNISLKKLPDGTLISDLKNLVAKEREILTQILHYLNEVETRRLYLQRGYSSLFAFMTEELGYSEAAAQRRIVAMRLIRDLPEVEEKIENGDISLTVASQVGSFFRQENEKRREQNTEPITREEKLGLLTTLQGTSRRECERKLAEMAPGTCMPKEKTRPISEGKTLIQFTAGKDLMRKIERLKALFSHQNKSGTLEELFEKLADLALDKHDPERRERRRQERAAKKGNTHKLIPPPEKVESPPVARAFRPASSQKKISRYIFPPLRDRIWLRDQGKCQHRDLKTGKLCGSKQRLEVDHRWPHALGGENTEENLQLKCRVHNQWRGEILFGKPGNP